jgi:hypothetical protein
MVRIVIFFLIGKGVKQGDPITPILFNSMADVFTRMLAKAATHGHFAGLMQSMTNTWVMCMQYADDTVLFLKTNLPSFINLKWMMSCFEQMCVMRINFHKCTKLRKEDIQPFVDKLLKKAAGWKAVQTRVGWKCAG